MAGLVFKIGADLEKLKQLKQEIVDLQAKLRALDKTADPKGFRDLEKQLKATEKELNRLGDKAVKENARIQKAMDETFHSGSKLSTLMAKIGGGVGFSMIIKDIVQTRGEFQQLDIAFATLLQNKDKANALMAQMIETAAKTPFTLQDVAGGAKQLIAYGFAAEDINETLIRLGNIASGLNLPLERLTYLYGTTMTQGRLYTRDLMQFTTSGIPMLQGLADMFGVSTSEINKMVEAGKIGFPEVQKVIESLTNQGGKFYQLMEQQSTTITGQISNLKDQISLMYNEIGKANEGVIFNSIEGLQYMVKHYDEIGKSILLLVAAYGSYKAALMTTAALQGASVFIDNIRLVGMFRKELGLLTATQQAFNLTAKANPYVLLITVLTTAAAAVGLFRKNTSEAVTYQEKLNQAMDNASKSANEEKARVLSLVDSIKNENVSRKERTKLLKDLVAIAPDHLEKLTLENIATNKGAQILDKYNQALLRKLQIQELEKQLGESLTRQEDARNGKNEISIVRRALLTVATTSGANMKPADEVITDANKELNDRIIKQETENQKQLREKLKKLYEAGSVDNIKPLPKDPANDPEKSKVKQYEKETLDQAEKLMKERNELEKARIKDKKELLDVELKQTIETINKEKQAYIDLAKQSGIKNPETKMFDDRIKTAQDITKAKKEELDSDDAEKKKKELDELLKEYQTFEQKRANLELKLNEDIKKLTDARTKDNATQIDETIKARKTAYQNELIDLQSEIIHSSTFYETLFSDITNKGYKTISNIAKQAKEVLSGAAHYKNESGESRVNIEMPTIDDNGMEVKKSVTMTLEEYQRLLDQVININRELEQQNPFKAFLNGFNELSAASKANDKDGVANAVTKLTNASNSSLDVLKNWAGSVGKLMGTGADSMVNDITTLVGGVTDLGMGIARIASGDIVGGITSSLQGIVSIVETVSKMQDEAKAQQRQIYLNEIEYQELLNKRNEKLIESARLVSAFIDDVQLLNELISQGFLPGDKNITSWEQMVEQYQNYIDQIDIQLNNRDNSWTLLTGSKYDSGWKPSGFLEWTRTVETISGKIAGKTKEQAEAILEIWYNSGELSDEAKAFYESWKASGESIQEFINKASELKRQMREMMIGASFDSFLDSVADFINQYKGDISDLAEFTEKTIQTAFLNSFKYKILAGMLEPLYNELADRFISGDVDAGFINDWSTRFNATVKDGYNKINMIAKGMGIGLDDSSTRDRSGGFASMSQDSADELNGRFTSLQMTAVSSEAILLRASDFLQGMSSELLTQSDIMRDTALWTQEIKNIQTQALIHLEDISNNTKKLGGISETLEKIKTNTDNL